MKWIALAMTWQVSRHHEVQVLCQGTSLPLGANFLSKHDKSDPQGMSSECHQISSEEKSSLENLLDHELNCSNMGATYTIATLASLRHPKNASGVSYLQHEK